MTIAERLKQLRTELGLSQEAMGAQSFVSTSGWIKLESGQRQPAEKLIDKLCNWLVGPDSPRGSNVVRYASATKLKTELLVLKYAGSPSPFVRRLALAEADRLGLVDAGKPTRTDKPVKGRPVRKPAKATA